MNFDIYFPIFKNNQWQPYVDPTPMSWDQILELSKRDDIVEFTRRAAAAEGDERQRIKKGIPMIIWTGRCAKTKANRYMKPTGLFMIDVDHCNVVHTFGDFLHRIENEAEWAKANIPLIHKTPSGEGLRFVVWCQPQFDTLLDNMKWFAEKYELEKYGDVDYPCKDFSRGSYMFTHENILWKTEDFDKEEAPEFAKVLENPDFDLSEDSPKKGEIFSTAETIGDFTDEEKLAFEGYDYKGTPLKQIIDKWVEVQGTPGRGEIHNYYNEMVKNFRNIVNNDKRALLYLLPRFGHSMDECWSSIKSICKVNTLSSLPRTFYFFLKDNGFYKPRVPSGKLHDYMMSEEETQTEDDMPWLPPVFREFVRISPKDFRPSMVNALLPVMGTLTSFLEAPYYYDGRNHTTSFFSVIYAPPGTGKGFAERVTDALFEKVKIRDYVQMARENVYLRAISKKSANDKAPDMPHTSLRIIPPKNSEAEFLQKQADNHGYHMFTFAAEMDSWAKGVRAAGGNKDDMIRIAWDNGEYGQQFRSANTFKGTVRLYWNVLITGTVQQLLDYFKNVENGLITRCSFTSIENQQFAAAPVWKTFNKKERLTIEKFVDRCDRNSYEEPCTLFPEDVDIVEDGKFDEEVDWHFKFRPKKTVDMEWLRPTIEKFLDEQLKRAALDLDNARDVFRRRAAVRGFRLGMICTALWENPKKADLMKCVPFIEWWMNQDIESSLKLWGAKYNEQTQAAPNVPQKSLYAELPQAFTKSDVYTACVKQGIKTPVRIVIHNWVKMGYVKKIDKTSYEKVNERNKEKDNEKK